MAENGAIHMYFVCGRCNNERTPRHEYGDVLRLEIIQMEFFAADLNELVAL